jgi:tetratricopeptide (TPR) repeat protein
LKRYLLILLLAFPLSVSAQVNLDSLWGIWNNPTQPDTNRLKALSKLTWDGYMFNKPDSAFILASLQYELAQKIKNYDHIARALTFQGISHVLRGDYDTGLKKLEDGLAVTKKHGTEKQLGRAYNNLGNTYKRHGNIEKAVECLTLSAEINEKLGDKKGLSTSLNNIGIIHKNQGQIGKAIELYHRSLKLSEEVGDIKGVARAHKNIGSLYKDQKEYDKALDHLRKSTAISIKLGANGTIANHMNSIGLVFFETQQYDSALYYYRKTEEITEKTGNKLLYAGNQQNIGLVYYKQEKYDKALQHFEHGAKILEEIGDKRALSIAQVNIGSVYSEYGDHKKALFYTNKGLKLGQELHNSEQIRDASRNSYESYKKLGKYSSAMEMYELYISTRDTIESEENKKEVIRQEFKRNYEKQSDSLKADQAKKEVLAEAEQKRKNALHKAEQQRKDDIAQRESEKKNLIIFSGAGGLLLILIFTGFIVNRLQITRKQKGIIEEQKNVVEEQKTVVEEKNKEILDSIHYAKRLQEAILPPMRLVKEWLPNSFILYKPKDIVAGDFYWMETVNNTIYFAAADCTGHGVPGAMVSVVCSNALTKALVEENIQDPGKILDRTRELVVERFDKSDEEVKDGMDIAICSLQGNTLMYAGANNPLWIVTKESERHAELIEADAKGSTFRLTQDDPLVIIETKATKQPIGKVDNPQPFQTHTFELQSNDTFYIFSDGYVDQFGGGKGKKFKAKALRELLLSIQSEPMEKQRKLINEAFEQWRGDLEQVDDVCVIGVKV